MESSNAYSTLSLDASDSSDDGPPSMLDTLGVDDEGLEHVEIRESIKPLLEGLGAREKRILLLRFFKNMTQSQIAEEIGVSQMHVSRLLTKTLAQLRDLARGGVARPPGARLSAGTRAPRCSAGGRGRRSRPGPPPRCPGTAAVVSPPRRFQARPSWMSWASRIGPRAQAPPWVIGPGAHHQQAAVQREEQRGGQAHGQPPAGQGGDLEDREER